MKISRQKQQQIALILICGVAACAALWQAVISAANQGIETANTQLARSQGNLDDARRGLQRREEVEAELADILRSLKTEEDRMASGVDLYSWSYQLLEKARPAEHGVRIRSVTRPSTGPHRLIPEFPYRETVFNIQGYAFFDGFGRFLANFENSFPYFRVEKIQLSPIPNLQDAALTDLSEVERDHARELLTFKMDIVALVQPQS